MNLQWIYISIIIISLILLAVFSLSADFRRKVIAAVGIGKYTEKMKQLYLDKEAYEESTSHIERNLKTIPLLCALLGAVCLICSMYLRDGYDSIDDYKVKRPEYGEQDKSLSVRISTKGGTDVEKIPILIRGRRYTDEKLDDFATDLSEYLRSEILNGNPSAMQVSKDMSFPPEVEGYPFTISWISENPLILSNEGILQKSEEIDSDNTAIPVTVRAVYKYQDYETQDYFRFIVLRKASNPRDIFTKSVEDAIEIALNSSKESEYVSLPREVDGIGIRYEEEGRKTDFMIFILGIVVIPLIWISRDKKIDETIQKRNEQMMMDYPRIVNQYVLYYSAGINTRGIWQLICENYRQRSTHEKRYAYEEMLLACRAMDEGVGEIRSYEMFAMRCRLAKYKTFVNLIEQVISKGPEKMGDLLAEEVVSAGKERVNRAKINGDKAATKLLLPMFLMLLSVIAIVTIPAFIGMNN